MKNQFYIPISPSTGSTELYITEGPKGSNDIDVSKAKYISRTGTSGHYKYVYHKQEMHGGTFTHEGRKAPEGQDQYSMHFTKDGKKKDLGTHPSESGGKAMAEQYAKDSKKLNETLELMNPKKQLKRNEEVHIKGVKWTVAGFDSVQQKVVLARYVTVGGKSHKQRIVRLRKTAEELNQYLESSKASKKKSEIYAVDLIKAGEGSRGGKVVGHTKSGKPIYQDKKSGDSKWTMEDHQDAHKLHSDKMWDAKMAKNKDLAEHHLSHVQHHYKESEKALQLKSEIYVVDLIKAGEGSRGGKVIGHTKSGKPIYDSAAHASHGSFNQADHKDASRLHRKLSDAEDEKAGIIGSKKGDKHFVHAEAHSESAKSKTRKPSAKGKKMVADDDKAWKELQRKDGPKGSKKPSKPKAWHIEHQNKDMSEKYHKFGVKGDDGSSQTFNSREAAEDHLKEHGKPIKYHS